MCRFAGHGKKDYLYVCTVLTVQDEHNFLVQGMRAVKGTKDRFTVAENDISVVELKDIRGILPLPHIGQNRRSLYYQFNGAVGVVEK